MSLDERDAARVGLLGVLYELGSGDSGHFVDYDELTKLMQLSRNEIIAAAKYLMGKGLADPTFSDMLVALSHEGVVAWERRLRSLRAREAAAGRRKRVFIGHGRAPLWRELKDFVVDRLHLECEESNRVPVVGLGTKERLSAMLDNSAFAFLILTAEEERSDQTRMANSSLLHEVGLFQGRLGFEKAIVLLEEGCEEISNIVGISHIRFRQGCIRDTFEDVRLVLEREQILRS